MGRGPDSRSHPQTTSSTLKGAIQLGIGYTVGNLSSKPERDVLMQDFYVVESIFFPRSERLARIQPCPPCPSLLSGSTHSCPLPGPAFSWLCPLPGPAFSLAPPTPHPFLGPTHLPAWPRPCGGVPPGPAWLLLAA